MLELQCKYLPIEDYAVIGDLHTVALVGKNGSIDWCCLPRFDAPTVFGALLDAEKGGFFRISPPATHDMRIFQMYMPDTNVLLTRFLCRDGIAEITDFMPIKADEDSHALPHHIVRSVAVYRGDMEFELTCRPAFNYARDAHDMRLTEQGALFHSRDLHLGLSTTLKLHPDNHGGVHTRFVLHKGESIHVMLESTTEGADTPEPLSEEDYQEMYHTTMQFWTSWLKKCQYQGRWREQVERSALVLKLLTYSPTGAIVAAPTTSLPETLGGTRNWDYRYTWLRDAAFSLYSLLTLGFTQEAEQFMGWLDDRTHELHSGGCLLQPMYGLDGQHDLVEETLSHLEGYKGSAPVRIGNGAYTQTQLDVFGELLDAIYIFNRYKAISYDLWQHIQSALHWLNDHWQEPDEGIWEVRGGKKPFVHSKLMSWVAFDRAQRIARHRGLPSPYMAWQQTSTDIYQQIMEEGWSEKQQSFVQYYGSEAVDASLLLMGLLKFTGAQEPRMLSTIRRIQRELAKSVLVSRYDPLDAANDGIGTYEGDFGACSFWLAESLARSGCPQEGRLLLEKMLSFSNHVGLFAEEVGPVGEALGNYPQAFTHLALITACVNIDRALDDKSDQGIP
ncbi:glycoside hydrolase family 15 protein [Ktedonospora formicarum]|uniref:Glucoamylase n=1 Tax=Ktedonospora formicarum TaxID=2778364 RepID=A0A8J3MXZ1_9CHLR|nr:glycoside hydrolase family 15 protein [Ktedonospora formicarum]GHO50233.1 glucoamylase [Ktedonospora formicarum]